MTRPARLPPPPSAPPARDETHPSRRAVLDAAARLFRHQGYAATSLRDIAEVAGMQAGSLYYHFDSKEEIVAEVLRTGIETVLHAVEAAVREARARGVGGSGLLEVAIRAHLESLLRVSDYTSADVRIYAHVPPAIRRQNLALRDRYEEVWRRLLA